MIFTLFINSYSYDKLVLWTDFDKKYQMFNTNQEIGDNMFSYDILVSF